MSRSWAVLFAGIVSLFTLVAFFFLMDYGPESAIRRFHHAVESSDKGELEAVVLQRGGDPGVAALVRRTRFFEEQGATFRVARMRRDSSTVTAAVVYNFPESESLVTLWVLKKESGAWEIDAQRSYTILKEALGL